MTPLSISSNTSPSSPLPPSHLFIVCTVSSFCGYVGTWQSITENLNIHPPFLICPFRCTLCDPPSLTNPFIPVVNFTYCRRQTNWWPIRSLFLFVATPSSGCAITTSYAVGTIQRQSRGFWDSSHRYISYTIFGLSSSQLSHNLRGKVANYLTN